MSTTEAKTPSQRTVITDSSELFNELRGGPKNPAFASFYTQFRAGDRVVSMAAESAEMLFAAAKKKGFLVQEGVGFRFVISPNSGTTHELMEIFNSKPKQEKS